MRKKVIALNLWDSIEILKKFATHGRLEQMRIFLEVANLSEFL